jgi:hypothetical protein
MNIPTLALADEGTAISSEVEDFLLTNLPYGFVDSFDVVWDVGDVLYGSIVSDDHVLHIIIPKANVDEFTEEPWADDLEFTGKDTTSVDITIAFNN